MGPTLTMPDTGQELHERLVIAVGTAWSSGEFSLLNTVLSPSFTWHTNTSHDVLTREDLKDLLMQVRHALPDIRFEIDDFVEMGQRLAMRWTLRATHSRVYYGIPPTHRVINSSGAAFATLSDDLISHTWATWDPRDLLRGVGIIFLEVNDDD
jgi:steroid delta-isomerase-like uncharacterized protein